MAKRVLARRGHTHPVVGGGTVVVGTVDGQVLIWDDSDTQWEPAGSTILRINPAAPPTNPLGRISATGFGTTDVRKSFLHLNVGASTATVWASNRNGGTPQGFFSRSALTGAQEHHDWGFWNPGNQTGIPIFTMTEDNEFIFEFTCFIQERSSALNDVAGRGQFWVRDDSPNLPMYTDDLGVDFELLAGSTVSTTAALVDVSNAINTVVSKKQGLMVWNSTTGAPVWSTGGADNSVWNDATGSTAHTPV